MRIFSFLFLACCFLEIASLIAVGSWLGFGLTFLLVLATTFIGIGLIRKSFRDVVALMRGQAPSLLPAVQLTLLAGLLLIIPGFLSDLGAVLLLLPPVQNYAARKFSAWVSRNAPPPPGGVVIEGEAVEIERPLKELNPPDR